MILVWSPLDCQENPETGQWTLIEQVADATTPMTDPKHTGPIRTQIYDAEFTLLSTGYAYNEASYGTEQDAIDAWIAYQPPGP